MVTPDESDDAVIRRALAGEVDVENSPLWQRLRAAGRGEIDASEVLTDGKKVKREDEPIADALMESVGRGPEIVSRGPKVKATFELDVSTLEVLDALARKYDYWWGGKGQITKLLNGIG